MEEVDELTCEKARWPSCFNMSELKQLIWAHQEAPEINVLLLTTGAGGQGPQGERTGPPQCPDLPGYCGTRMHIDTHKIHLKNR